MAITQTAHLNMVESTGNINSFTQSLDCAGGTTLVVAVNNQVNTAGDLTGVTYNGTAMTKIGVSNRSSDNREISLWGLHSPASGANNIVASRTTTSTTVMRMAAISFAGTATGTAIPVAPANDAATGATTASSAISVTLSNGAGAGFYAITVTAASTGPTAGTGAASLSGVDIIWDWKSNPFPAGASHQFIVNATAGNNAIVAVAIEAAASSLINSINGQAYSGDSSIDGVAVASISSIMGVA